MEETTSLVDNRAKELILQAAKEIIATEERIAELQVNIKDMKNEIKGEGINVKALNTAIKRYKAYLEGKSSLEEELSESDIYLDVLKGY